eukprot:4541039-Lingulodinium_polyedra.AAC.1
MISASSPPPPSVTLQGGDDAEIIERVEALLQRLGEKERVVAEYCDVVSNRPGAPPGLGDPQGRGPGA